MDSVEWVETAAHRFGSVERLVSKIQGEIQSYVSYDLQSDSSHWSGFPGWPDGSWLVSTRWEHPAENFQVSDSRYNIWEETGLRRDFAGGALQLGLAKETNLAGSSSTAGYRKL